MHQYRLLIDNLREKESITLERKTNSILNVFSVQCSVTREPPPPPPLHSPPPKYYMSPLLAEVTGFECNGEGG